MWGIIPAAGNGTRIQPLAFSKELLPVGSWLDVTGVERPRAVSEYLVERMVRAGVTRLCFVISPWKSDIPRYYGGSVGDVALAYVIQDQADGLCDAIFRALPLIRPDEAVIVGLPDTVWFPCDALVGLPDDRFSMLLFPVANPELFDAVETSASGQVLQVQVKSSSASTGWVWGAFKLPGSILRELHGLWLKRDRSDLYLGTLINAWIETGGESWGVPDGESYVDVGTLNGYRQALRLLEQADPPRDSLQMSRPDPERSRRSRP
jgi:glucose-1-phosphate thymidylyltransferase